MLFVSLWVRIISNEFTLLFDHFLKIINIQVILPFIVSCIQLINLNLSLQIKRPYFHVKPLERCQLKNWKEYLDYEIEQGDQNRIIVLFERCLIACALYEEFWIKVWFNVFGI